MLAALFGLVLAGSLGVGAGLRSYSKARLTTLQEGNVVALSLGGGDGETLRDRVTGALADPEVHARVREHPAEHTLVAYVVPQDYMMQHLVADLGEHEAHHGGGDAGGVWAAIGHLGQMYALKPLRQLRSGVESPDQRIIFTEAVTPSGGPVGPDRALAADVLRFPLFFADLEGREVVMTMETPRRHSWGTIPVPAF